MAINTLDAWSVVQMRGLIWVALLTSLGYTISVPYCPFVWIVASYAAESRLVMRSCQELIPLFVVSDKPSASIDRIGITSVVAGSSHEIHIISFGIRNSDLSIYG